MAQAPVATGQWPQAFLISLSWPPEAASLTRITVPCLLTSHPPCWHLNFCSSCVPRLGQQPEGALALGERVGFPWAGPLFLRSPWAQAGGRAWSGAEGFLRTREALSHSKGGWVLKLSEERAGAVGPLGAGAQSQSGEQSGSPHPGWGPHNTMVARSGGPSGSTSEPFPEAGLTSEPGCGLRV